MKKVLFSLVVLLGMSKFSMAATSTASPVVLPTSVAISSASQSGGAAAIIISSPTNQGVYSTGYTNYLTHSRIEMYAVGTLSGGATPVTCTTQNLNGIVYKFPTALAIGAMVVDDIEFTNAQAASATGAYIEISCPATTNVIWNINANSYSAN